MSWLLQLWDTEVDSIICMGDETECLVSMTTHPLLQQRLHNTRQHMQGPPNQTRFLMEWINATIQFGLMWDFPDTV